MSLAMPVVSSSRCRAHRPEGEVWVGVRTAGTEVPERLDVIARALVAAGAVVVEAEAQPDERALRAHTPELVAYVREAWERWQSSELTDDPGGQDRVVPYLFPHPGLLGDLPLREATSVAANAGRHCYDTMSLIGPGTWEAARAALDVAITAADLAVDGGRHGAAYALCRPPGHHACADAFGGSCYLNNAAAAALAMAERVEGKVAVIDIDAHHGNGTQSIFYESGEVLTGSVHVDPAAGWFPHYLGFAEETGSGEGRGANLNLPLPPGASDAEWLEAVAQLARWAREQGAEALVVALGVDAAGGDPESPLEVSRGGYERAGAELARLGVPTAIVQEGGYDLASIGQLVVATLSGFEEGRA